MRRGWGEEAVEERERPPASILAFSSSPSAGGREILIGFLAVKNVSTQHAGKVMQKSQNGVSYDGRAGRMHQCGSRFY